MGRFLALVGLFAFAAPLILPFPGLVEVLSSPEERHLL